MRIIPHIHSLTTALCIAALAAGCGGGDAPTEPTPARATINLDVAQIEVIGDCDGVEGDGDFDFEVVSWGGWQDATTVLYHERPNLGPGGMTPTIGRQSYTTDAVEGAYVSIRFTASELDRDIFGYEYNDARLAFEIDSQVHVFRDGRWSNLGRQSLTLGSDDECRVRLTWIAST